MVINNSIYFLSLNNYFYHNVCQKVCYHTGGVTLSEDFANVGYSHILCVAQRPYGKKRAFHKQCS
jgi:hypothetical protein